MWPPEERQLRPESEEDATAEKVAGRAPYGPQANKPVQGCRRAPYGPYSHQSDRPDVGERQVPDVRRSFKGAHPDVRLTSPRPASPLLCSLTSSGAVLPVPQVTRGNPLLLDSPPATQESAAEQRAVSGIGEPGRLSRKGEPTSRRGQSSEADERHLSEPVLCGSPTVYHTEECERFRVYSYIVPISRIPR